MDVIGFVCWKSIVIGQRKWTKRWTSSILLSTFFSLDGKRCQKHKSLKENAIRYFEEGSLYDMTNSFILEAMVREVFIPSTYVHHIYVYIQIQIIILGSAEWASQYSNELRHREITIFFAMDHVSSHKNPTQAYNKLGRETMCVYHWFASRDTFKIQSGCFLSTSQCLFLYYYPFYCCSTIYSPIYLHLIPSSV